MEPNEVEALWPAGSVGGNRPGARSGARSSSYDAPSRQPVVGAQRRASTKEAARARDDEGGRRAGSGRVGTHGGGRGTL